MKFMLLLLIQGKGMFKAISLLCEMLLNYIAGICKFEEQIPLSLLFEYVYS